jgi:RNA-binding protein
VEVASKNEGVMGNMRVRGREREEVVINVGKKGVTEGLINEINMLIEKRGRVKVRMLRNFREMGEAEGKDKKMLAQEISSRVKGKLVDFRGFVLTFERC